MSMQAITPIILRMDSPNTLQRVYAKQNDKLSRYIVASLACGAAAWTPPEGVAGAIRYKKPDGTAGFYDTAEDGTDAIAMSGATVKMYLAEQVLTVPGEVAMEINFYTAAGAKLTSFGWTLVVKPSVVPDSAIQSTDYYNTLTAQIAKALEYKNAAAASATAAAASAAAAASSAEGAASTLASAVKSVNGLLPDEAGNVALIKRMSIDVKDYTPNWQTGAGPTYFWYVTNWTSLGISRDQVVGAFFGTWGGFNSTVIPTVMLSPNGVALVATTNTWTCTSLEIVICYV